MRRTALWLVVIGLALAVAWDVSPADPAVLAVTDQRVGRCVWVYAASDPLTRVHDLTERYGPTARVGESVLPAARIAAVLADSDEHRCARTLHHALELVASHDLPGPTYVDDESAEAIEAALDRAMTLHATERPLSQVLAEIQHVIGAPITVVWNNLSAQPTDLVNFHGRTTARRVLRAVLQSADGYSVIDYRVRSGAVELGRPLRDVHIYGARFPMARLRVYPVQHLQAQGLDGDRLRKKFRDAFGYHDDPWERSRQPVWHEPAGAMVVAATSRDHEGVQGQFRGVEVLPPAPSQPVARVLDRSIPLDRQRRSLPQFVEYLAQQTGVPVFVRCHWLPVDHVHPQIESDGEGGTLREHLGRVLSRVQLAAVESGDAIYITTLREANPLP